MLHDGSSAHEICGLTRETAGKQEQPDASPSPISPLPPPLREIRLNRVWPRAEVTLADAAQLAQWPVAHLKALLIDHGLRCRTCVEKADFRAFILEHVLRAAPPRDEL